jgi:phosphatidylserine decarboxylase
MTLIGVILLTFGIKFLSVKYISIPLIILAGLMFLFTFWFFRDPDRTIPEQAKNDTSYIVSPADGTITEIVEEFEKHYLKTNSKRITIFLSPLNVHVNRNPASGIVEFYDYERGKKLIANNPKASELNEQSRIGLKTDFGKKILYKQIVGTVARRVVCGLKIGDKAQIGERFGMMKFGSRMDIAIPIESEISIKIGDKVIAGETIIARLK